MTHWLLPALQARGVHCYYYTVIDTHPTMSNIHYTQRNTMTYTLNVVNRILLLFSCIQGFRRAVTLGERDLGNGKQLGEAYYHLVDIVSANPRRLQEALEICERAIRHVKGFGHLYIACSNLLVLANRTQDALPVTKMAANSNPKSSVAHYNLGLVHMKLGHLSEAAVAFRTALSIQQDSVQVMYNLASILQVTANGRQDTLYEALEL